ncbi:hypothetical protein, partial [Stenotrophomonas maltophilia]|uniref:hypothetical protein n=1 Tax=Stenotrophomonas maltophilia TaxID=40324 RepID=UPI001952C383
MTVSTAPTSSVSIVLYIGGYRISVPVNALMTSANCATAIAAAINACPGIVVSAAVDGTTASKVNITALNKGSLGNGIRIETNLNAGDGNAADVLTTIVQLTGGNGDPDITNAIANMGDEQWDWIVMPYCIGATLTQMEAWLDARWGPMSQMYGHQ